MASENKPLIGRLERERRKLGISRNIGRPEEFPLTKLNTKKLIQS